jgi:tRNA1(Val) A37 N6-methylase TrmN6
LGGGIFAVTSDRHTFGADAVLLADFAAVRTAKRLCDLCAGCGIVSLLWSRNGDFKIDAIEIQNEAAQLCIQAAKLNCLDGIHVIENDLCRLDSSYNGVYDLVACNPPYKKADTGKPSIDDAARTARHETSCTLEDVVAAAARMLKSGGRFCLCHRPERLTDLLTLMRVQRVEPKRLRFVQQRVSTKPWLVLVEGKKHAKPGILTEATLIVEGEDGGYSDEMNRIYGFT